MYASLILPEGRPKLRWTDMIHKDLKDTDIQKELAEDKVAWRAAIKPLRDTNKCV